MQGLSALSVYFVSSVSFLSSAPQSPPALSVSITAWVVWVFQCLSPQITSFLSKMSLNGFCINR